ncbi:MAG: META domain-containing protein [Bradyrhizobiaceae bacterium]|nr:META domain-containing protein [Bradyrhizobiaceae bacterium]
MKSLFTVALVIATSILVGCSSSSSTKVDPMAASWQVVQMGARVIKGDGSMTPTLQFDPVKMTVNGSTGCNVYSGKFSNDINALSFSNVAVTKKACEDEAMAIETQFVDVLNKTAKMKVDGDVLMLMDAAGLELLRAKAKE